MSEMRLMEKFRLQKLTDFSYVWDTTYTTICNRAGDDYSTDVRTSASSATSTGYTDYPTYHITTTNFIVPRRYKYTTVLDGIVRSCVKVNMNIPGGTGEPYTGYVRFKIHLKAITSAGVKRTLASTGYSAVFSGTGRLDPGEWTLTLAIPFLWDIDNAILENDERLLISIDAETTGSGYGGRSLVVTIYHTINTDDSFFEIPIKP